MTNIPFGTHHSVLFRVTAGYTSSEAMDVFTARQTLSGKSTAYRRIKGAQISTKRIFSVPILDKRFEDHIRKHYTQCTLVRTHDTNNIWSSSLAQVCDYFMYNYSSTVAELEQQ